MRNVRIWQKRGLVLLLMVGMICVACGCNLFTDNSGAAAPTLVTPKPMVYNFYEVKRGSLVRESSGYGSVVSLVYDKYYFTAGGSTVSSFDVKMGDTVTSGQTLVTLKDGRKLTSRMNGTVAYLNNAYLDVKKPDVAIEAEKTMVVIQSNDPNSIYITFEKTASENVYFTFGSELTLRKTGTEKSFTGKVVSSSVVANAIGEQVSVDKYYCKPVADQEEIKVGDMVKYTYVEDSKEDCLIIPIYAFFTNYEGLKYVFVLDQNNLRTTKYIETGMSTDTEIEVINGLEEGESILLTDRDSGSFQR